MKQALYRKYRPKTFDEVYGQNNIVNILKNQIKNNKISHAYIFSGTRGTGKTSTAKIFAKAVNCLSPVDGSPCNECTNCLAVNSEKSMDIVEMDAASNRRIDDIRQLRDQVIYPPSLLKYKVYIIDEAHMITKEGFNALLKIMEEPPEYLIFILATTEIEKIPDTILSRTQRFEFKSLSIENIKKQINYILEKENVSIENRAVEIIANVASGAMRDALSVLDQVISIGKNDITTSDVYDLLGVFSDEVKIEYCRHLFTKNIKGLLKLIDDELDKGKDPNNFIKEIVTFFKDLIYIKIEVRENFYGNLLDDISLDQLINSVDILLEYEELMKKSDSAELLFRVASVRLIDYMPRNQLEAKIKNLEDRILYLENNRESLLNKNRNLNKKENTDITKITDENINIETVEKFLEEYDSNDSKDEEILKDIKGSKDIKDSKDIKESKNIKDLNELTDSGYLRDTEDLNNLESSSDDIDNNKSKKRENEIVEDNESYDKETDEAKSKDHREILLNILRENYKPTNILLKGLEKIEQKTDKIVLYVDSEHISLSLGMGFFFKRARQDLYDKVGKDYEIKVEIFEEKRDNNMYDDKKVEKLKSIFPKDKFVIKEKK